MDQDDLECQLLDKLKSIQSHDRSCFWREIILHHEKGRTGNRPVVQIDRYLQASIARTSSFDAFLQDLRRVNDSFPDEMVQKMTTLMQAFLALDFQFGYSPFMKNILALLLRRLDDDFTFRALVLMIEQLVPSYFQVQLPEHRIDANIFSLLFNSHFPALAEHLDSFSDEVCFESLYGSWFESLFSNQNKEFAERFWDGFLFYGRAWIFEIALSLHEMNAQKILLLRDAAQVKEFLSHGIFPSEENEIEELLKLAASRFISDFRQSISDFNPLRDSLRTQFFQNSALLLSIKEKTFPIFEECIGFTRNFLADCVQISQREICPRNFFNLLARLHGKLALLERILLQTDSFVSLHKGLPNTLNKISNLCSHILLIRSISVEAGWYSVLESHSASNRNVNWNCVLIGDPKMYQFYMESLNTILNHANSFSGILEELFKINNPLPSVRKDSIYVKEELGQLSSELHGLMQWQSIVQNQTIASTKFFQDQDPRYKISRSVYSYPKRPSSRISFSKPGLHFRIRIPQSNHNLN